MTRAKSSANLALNDVSKRRQQRLWILGAVVLGLLAVRLVLHAPGGEPNRGETAYYYDLNTGELFPGPIRAIPPIPAPSGTSMPDGSAAGVRAYVFSCGECKPGAERFIGYLTTTALNASAQAQPDAKAAEPSSTAPGAESVDSALDFLSRAQTAKWLVALPDLKGGWVDASSQAGVALISAATATDRCGGRPVVECAP